MHAHLVQLDIAWEDRGENFRRTDALLAASRDRLHPGDLVVLPEMFDTGFSFRLAITADRDGATLAFLRQLARTYNITLQGSRTVVSASGRGLNRCTVVAPGGEVLVEYDKIHPFSFGKEPEYFDAGSRVVTYPWTCDGSTLIVCPSICYDLRFPELYREGLRQGAEVFALGANWPTPRKIHRVALGVARAIENQAYVLCVNRAGNDPHLHYAGESYAVDPRGQIILDAGQGQTVASVRISPEELHDWRTQFPAWKDRRL